MRYEDLRSEAINRINEQTFWDYFFNECKNISGTMIDCKTGVYHILQSTDDELICFLLDKNNQDAVEELADEDSLSGEKPFYFTAKSHRVSPVFRLWQIMYLYKNKFEDKKVFGILVSNNIFVNRDDLAETWDALSITVLSGMNNIPDVVPYKQASSLEIEVNDSNLANPLEFTKEIEETLFRNSIEEQTLETTVVHQTKHNDNQGNQKEIRWQDLVEEDDPDFYETIVNHKIAKPLPGIKILPPLNNPADDLNNLIALDNVKKKIRQISSLSEYNRRLSDSGIKTMPMNLHYLFIGAPGTGKTTVAQIIGSIFHQHGLLSKGHTIISNRGTYVGKLWGSEEENVRKVLKLAQGGVLLIDEAYLLYNEHEPRDPANHILPLMMDLLADEKRRDISIILCGYHKNMDIMLNSNPGLRSRFRNQIIFEDFSFDELSEIMYKRAKENGYKFTDKGWALTLETIKNIINISHHDNYTYANAREVINLWEQILENHAYRCISEEVSDLEKLLLITESDIPEPQR